MGGGLEAGGGGRSGGWVSWGFRWTRRGFSEESQKPVGEERGRGGQSPKPGPCVDQTRWCLRAAWGQGRGRARRRGVCFTLLKVVFPSWTVLNLSHHFLPWEGKPHAVLPCRASAGVGPGRCWRQAQHLGPVPWHGRAARGAPMTWGTGTCGHGVDEAQSFRC